MTTGEIAATKELDLHLSCTGGVWRLECRALELVAEAAGDTPALAAKGMREGLPEIVKALAVAETAGVLMATGCRRLTRLRRLITVLDLLAPVAVAGK